MNIDLISKKHREHMQIKKKVKKPQRKNTQSMWMDNSQKKKYELANDHKK